MDPKITTLQNDGKILTMTCNLADLLSRSPSQTQDQDNNADEYIRYVAKYSVPTGITIDELIRCSVEDKEITQFRECIKNNSWGIQPHMKGHKSNKEDFAVKDGLVLKNNKIMIPEALREKTLALGHIGH